MRKTDVFETLTYFHREKQREMRTEVIGGRLICEGRGSEALTNPDFHRKHLRVRHLDESHRRGVPASASRHGLFAREPPVVKGMHVNHLLRFDDGGRLGFLFPPPLAFQRHPELLHHRAAERTLRTEEQTTHTC